MRKRFDKLDQMENKDGAGDHGSVQTVGKETYESRITEGVLNAKQGNHKMQVKTNENTNHLFTIKQNNKLIYCKFIRYP